MKNEKGPSRPAVPKSRGGEQFADPLAWTPDNRPPAPPGSRPPGLTPDDQREREINRRIIAEYGQGPLDQIKPLIGFAIVGLIVFSQVDRSNMLNALIYSAMGMMAAGAIYVMIARDTLPPLVSMLFRGFFILGVIAVIGWFIVNNTSTFSRPLDKDTRTYRSATDPNAQ
jgi:hypothetical protein